MNKKRKNMFDKSLDKFFLEVGGLMLILFGGLIGIITLAIIDQPQLVFGLVVFGCLWLIV